MIGDDQAYRPANQDWYKYLKHNDRWRSGLQAMQPKLDINISKNNCNRHREISETMVDTWCYIKYEAPLDLSRKSNYIWSLVMYNDTLEAWPYYLNWHVTKYKRETSTQI